MKLILNQDVNNLGEEGDVVTVRDGYGRNYLLPTKAAMPYTPGNLAIVKARSAAIEKRKQEKRAASATTKEKLDAIGELTLVVSAGESGKLFGSVTSQMVQDAIAKQIGVTIERKKLEVPTHAIKMTGTYEVRAHLYEDDFSVLKLVVKSDAQVKAEEAAAKKAAEEAAKKEAEEAAQKEAEAKAAEEPAPAAEAPAEEAAPAQEN